MEQIPSIVFITLIVGTAMLVAKLFDLLSECISKWFYKRDRKRFKMEVAVGKRPDWIPYHVNSDGSIHIDPEDFFHTATYKQFEDFSKRN